MNEHHKLSTAGANLIKHFEGCLKKDGNKFRAYKCPANVATIGWGHTNHHGRKFDMKSVWTLEECNEEFLKDMEGFEKDVLRLVKSKINGFQFDALVSLTYNIGAGNLARSSLLRYVNQGDFDAASKEFIKWNKANGKVLAGLTRRRKSESLLFQGITDNNYDGDPDMPMTYMSDPMAQQVDEPEE